jgi:DNA replication licensing factor MCM3
MTLTGKRAKKSSASQSSAADTTGADASAMETIQEEEDGEASITEERFDVFKKCLTQLFRETRAQSLPMARFREHLGQQFSNQPFRKPEINAAFQRMTDANQIMVADDIIFLI